MAAQSASQADRAVSFALALLLLVPVQLLRAVVLTDLWRWFVMPLGVRAISMGQALGLSILVAMVTYTYVDNDEEHPALLGMFRCAAFALVAWAFGAIYSRFV